MDVASAAAADPPIGDIDTIRLPDLFAWATHRDGAPVAPILTVEGWMANLVSARCARHDLADLDLPLRCGIHARLPRLAVDRVAALPFWTVRLHAVIGGELRAVAERRFPSPGAG